MEGWLESWSGGARGWRGARGADRKAREFPRRDPGSKDPVGFRPPDYPRAPGSNLVDDAPELG